MECLNDESLDYTNLGNCISYDFCPLWNLVYKRKEMKETLPYWCYLAGALLFALGTILVLINHYRSV